MRPPDLTAAQCPSIPCSIAYHNPVHGCPDAGGCDLYTPGSYPSGITVTKETAVFDPGLYYVTGGMSLQSNSNVRPSTYPGTGVNAIGGTIFYFTDTSSLDVWANSGGGTTDAFNTSAMKCTGSSQLPSNIPATINGNMLLAPCTGTYGDPLGTSNPIGEQRGILFFQNRTRQATALWGGGGDSTFSGMIYIHQCVTSGNDTGTGCSASAYRSGLSMGGNSCSSSYAYGGIIADTLFTGGSASCIKLDLNPTPSFITLKVGLLR